MKKLIMMALVAAVSVPGAALPTVASAQDRRDDRRDARQDRRGDRRDYRRDRRDDRRDYRRDRRDDRRDHRAERHRNWGPNDWRSYRNHNRRQFARGNWRAPFRYRSFRPGVRIAPSYFGTRFVIGDPWRYRLPPVRGSQRYVRHYDDLLLIDARRGIVLRVYRNFFW